MEIAKKILTKLRIRLKIGSKRGLHLNAIHGSSRYKIDSSLIKEEHTNKSNHSK